MEVFAGFGEYTDHDWPPFLPFRPSVTKVSLDNTLILYVVGDNGASAEGGAIGPFNEFSYFNGFDEPLELQLERIDLLGGPMAFNHYAAGWAVAGDLPFTWTKQIASSYGGTRNPLVVHWPNGIKTKNEVRSQWLLKWWMSQQRPFWKRRACRSRNQSTAPGKSRCKASAWSIRSTTQVRPIGI